MSTSLLNITQILTKLKDYTGKSLLNTRHLTEPVYWDQNVYKHDTPPMFTSIANIIRFFVDFMSEESESAFTP